MAENGEKKAKEFVAIPVKLFPNWKGKVTETDKRCSAHGIKYTIVDLPVPATDEEAMAIYNCDRVALIEAGVIQKAYNERKATEMLAGASAEQVNSPEWQKGWAEVMKASLFAVPAVRTGKMAETKKKASAYDALMSKLGITDEAELEAIIAQAQKKKVK